MTSSARVTVLPVPALPTIAAGRLARAASIAESAGKKVMLHAGGRNPYGQHFSHALSCVPWLEYFVRGAPGVPLEETIDVPEQKIPKDGWMELDDRPGFGLGIQESWLTPY